MSRATRKLRHRDESAAVIVEFALVSIAFMILVAGIITYGMVFAIQQSLTHATSEAARSVVGIEEVSAAETKARSTALRQLSRTEDGWLEREALAVQVSGLAPCDPDTSDCTVEVTASYEGRLLGLLPFRIAVPDALSASAELQHDIRG